MDKRPHMCLGKCPRNQTPAHEFSKLCQTFKLLSAKQGGKWGCNYQSIHFLKVKAEKWEGLGGLQSWQCLKAFLHKQDQQL